jgi:iron complex outermembrane receptor protein
VLGAVLASAQTAGRLAGVVRDATAHLLSGVTLTVSGGAASMAPRTVVTDADGQYLFDAIPAGRYLLTAGFSGLEPWSANVDVGANGSTLDIVLTVAAVSERVTVTATRTGTAEIQSTPVAITALTAATLEQLGVQTVEGLAGLVPTLTISQHTGLAQVTIRGIGTNGGGDPSSTIHLDGVYLGRPAMVFADLLNVERVEVLRGPQGTLYGRNSVGGTINIVTRHPTNTPEANARFTAGNYAARRAEGAISGPLITNHVMGNVAVLRSTRNGFVHDLDHPDHALGGEDTWAGRGQLRIFFGSRYELLLSHDYSRAEGVPLTYAKPLVAKGDFTFDHPGDLWTVRTSDLTSGKNIQQGTSAKLAVRVNSTTTLTSLTAYRRSNYRFFIDSDATELSVHTADNADIQRQVSQELTIVQHTSKLTWIGGAFVFDEHTDGPLEITLYLNQIQRRSRATVRTNAWALFGQATYMVSSRVSLTGGVRYTDEGKNLQSTGGVYRLGTTSLADPASYYAFVDRAASDAWTPKVCIQVLASPDTFFYASATRGFKSGGINTTTPKPGLAFRPEFAWSYEGGLKRTMSGGRVRLKTAAFYNDYRDLQVQSFVGPGVLDISNAGAATIKGLEAEATALAGPHLRLAGHVAWLDASYDRYLAFVPGRDTREDAAGHRLNNAPEWSGSGSAVYEIAIAEAGTAYVRGDVSWQSRVFFTPANDAIETQPLYGLLHIRAGVEPRSRRWEMAVYVRNPGRHEYITGTFNVPLTAITGRPGESRHWGAQFTIRR